ncbi:SRPBCC family protein [Pseudarthrobacter sp. PS3-L1]|nr:SRPBCC family protein [Pseudarthrobacter sp. PS3-L1]MDJ0319010.1 SRPBCC family protein [Pseudarthrobacter sp. PS3-L1]
MAMVEHEVLVHCDAMTVYSYLLDGTNLPQWREGVRSCHLSAGVAGGAGARYQVLLTGPGGRAVAGDFEVTRARPGAEIEMNILAGPVRPKGGYYFSTEGNNTRVRYALEYHPRGLMSLFGGAVQRGLKTEVEQLSRLKDVLDRHQVR